VGVREVGFGIWGTGGKLGGWDRNRESRVSREGYGLFESLGLEI